MTDSEKLNLILDKVTGLDVKVTNLDEKLTELDEKVTDLDEKVTDLDEKVTDLNKKVTDLDEKVTELEVDMREVKQTVTKTDMTIENEIRVNIQRVAEGHLDLSRNLQAIMKPNSEIEMMSIKMRILETDVRDLKEKIS